MEIQRQELPNSTLILIFGILSIIGCCCYGVVGLVFGIITMLMAQKATNIYNENPEMYNGYQNVKTGKILAVIGIVLSALVLIIGIVSLIIFGGLEGIEEMQREMMEQYGG
jgi:multisubunit Na+/H+ antiporter MnhB subunit